MKNTVYPIPKTDLYFEAHITIDPIGQADKEDLFEELCRKYWFKPAEFLLKKHRPAERADAFCTGRSKKYDDISFRLEKLVDELRQNGFDIRRYKIENTIIDVRFKMPEMKRKFD